MSERLQSFEAGATVGAGNNVTAANSDDAGEFAISSPTLNGGTIVYVNDSAKVMDGSWAAEIDQPTSSSTTYFDIIDGGAGSANYSIQFCLRFTGLPGATMGWPVGLRSTTNAQLGGLRVGADGFCRFVRPSGSTVFTGTNALSTNTKYVFSLYGVGGSTTVGEAHLRVYDWATGSTVESLDGTGFDMTTALIDRFRYGKGDNAAGVATHVIDGIKQNVGSSTPYTYSPPPPSTTWTYGYDVVIG